MKNLLLFLSFAFISLTGYSQSQTFTMSHDTNGTWHSNYAVAIPNGNGYTYTYTLSGTNPDITIESQAQGVLGSLKEFNTDYFSTWGSGTVDTSNAMIRYQDVLEITMKNNPGSGYAEITVNPF